MTTTFGILQVAKSGLRVQQQAMNVTAHNLANASTDGYSRQRAVMIASRPLQLPEGIFGSGVQIATVQRMGDALLDATYFRELSGFSGEQTRAGTLSRVEELFGEPSDAGLGASLDAFFSAWSELGTNPGSETQRSVTRLAGEQLATKINQLGEGLDLLRLESETRLTSAVNDATRLASEVASLNQQITLQEADGSTASDLRDERARRLSSLAELAPINVIERENGSVGVIMEGIAIVDGAESMVLEVRSTAGVVGVSTPGRVNDIAIKGGALGGLIEVVNTDVPVVRQGLDDLVAGLVAEVNAIHAGGTNPAGTTGIDFFDAAGLTATSIALSADVTASASMVSAGTADGLGGYRAGANDIALSLAELRDVASPSLGVSYQTHYQGVVFDLGQEVRSSLDSAEVHRSLADQADLRRMELSSVSVDEELVKMIEFQTAYQSSARVITAVDEMLQTLLTV